MLLFAFYISIHLNRNSLAPNSVHWGPYACCHCQITFIFHGTRTGTIKIQNGFGCAQRAGLNSTIERHLYNKALQGGKRFVLS
mmetsp:Transcript_12701/g.20161  ORF Transcript_12701/g.20161 Transcript_12701/m.20161 type:complete len:83 (-) Transcript_12701:499-747(-)